MEKLTTKDKTLITTLFFITCIAIFIYFTMPINIVGKSPMLLALITYVSFFGSLMGITVIYFKNKPNRKKVFDNILIALVMLGAGGGIPGVLLTGIKFEKAKEIHLNKHGIITRATITDKIGRSVSWKGKKSEGFELYFTYKTKDGQSIDSWFVVDEEEFIKVNKGDVVGAIYSSKTANVVDLLISNESFDNYKEKIQNHLEKK